MSDDIIKQLEDILKAQKASKEKETSESIETETTSKETTSDPSKTSFWQYLIQAIKAPFEYFVNFMKIEVTEAIKKDVRRSITMLFLVLLLFTMVMVFWGTLQFGLYTYLISIQFSTLIAVLISLGVQILCLIVVMYSLYWNSKSMETTKLIQKFKDSTKK